MENIMRYGDPASTLQEIDLHPIRISGKNTIVGRNFRRRSPVRDFYVILFPGTNHAIRAGRTLESLLDDVKLIPVPRHLSSDCGIAVRIRAGDRNRAEDELVSRNIEFTRCVPEKTE